MQLITPYNSPLQVRESPTNSIGMQAKSRAVSLSKGERIRTRNKNMLVILTIKLLLLLRGKEIRSSEFIRAVAGAADDNDDGDDDTPCPHSSSLFPQKSILVGVNFQVQ